MKQLVLIRHAKSSWEYPELPDRERPLNKRGIRDAPLMGQFLHDQGVHADLILSSPAVRAYTTARIIAMQLAFDVDQINVVSDIYGAYHEELLDLVRGVDDAYSSVFMFGHNPEFTSLANYFSDSYIDNVPTCGVVRIKVECEKWKDLNKMNARVVAFDFPKKLKFN